MASPFLSRALGVGGRLHSPLVRMPLRSNASVRRAFSQTAATQNRTALNTLLETHVADVLTYIPRVALDTIHAVGLPWYAAIPLAAVLARGVLVPYFTRRQTRKVIVVQTSLTPITTARSRIQLTHFQQRKMNEKNPPPPDLQKFRDGLMHTYFSIANKHKFGKQFGAPLFRWGALANLATLLTVTEAIRIKCGGAHGLLSVITSPIQWVKKLVLWPVTPVEGSEADIVWQKYLASRGSDTSSSSPSPAVQVPADSLPVEELSHESLLAAESLPVEQPSHEGLLDPTLQTEGLPVEQYSHESLLDPTLQTEGLFWCPDLTAADPTMMLPIALSTAIAAGVFAQSNLFKRNNTSVPRPAFTWLQYVGLALSVFMLNVASTMPAGVVLYMVASLATGWVQTRWASRRYRTPAAIQACRRPIRIRVRKGLGEE